MCDQRNEQGFTLIETMVTVIIVSVGILAMASLLIGNMKANQGSEQRFNAAAISDSILASYQSKYSDGTWTPAMTFGSVTTVTVTKANSGYGVAYTITATAISEGLMVEVEISDTRLTSTFKNQAMISTWQ